MTDETTDATSAVDTAEPEPAQNSAHEPAAGHAAGDAEPAERVPFWQRPNVERYLVPLVMPVVVVLGLVVYVLNISRVFLSAHGHIAVAIGTVITIAILLGATALSNSGRLRSTSIVLLTAGFVFLVVSGGWLVLGHSQEKNAGGAKLSATGPYNGTLTIVAQPGGGPLVFAPASLTVKTGIYLVTLTDGVDGPHTLDFDDSTDTLYAGLAVNSKGETVKTRIFFPKEGDYTFFCAIPGHRQAGMQGVVHVTGAPLTLAQAEASGKSGGAASSTAK